jgi:hypothetical protein
MTLTNPYGTKRPCIGCEHFGGFVYEARLVRCVRGAVQIQASPEQGCAFWVRAIGADDELLPKDERSPLPRAPHFDQSTTPDQPTRSR